MPAAPVAATSSGPLRSRRGEASLLTLYALGALVAAAFGFGFLHWDPTKNARTEDAAKKLRDAEARYFAATDAVNSARQALEQQAAALANDTKHQTQTAQSMVAATGQALAAAPAEIRGDLHVTAAIQTNTIASDALEKALGALSPEQLAAVTRLVANATAASESRRAQATEELQSVRQQLAAQQQEKVQHQQLLREAATKLTAAEKNASDTKASLDQTTSHLQKVISSHDGLGLALGRFFFWLKLGLILYVLIAYGLPILARLVPATRVLAELSHALLAPFAHHEKIRFANLARDASASTDELLELIATRTPDVLQEARARAGAWITEHDGARARYEEMLKLAHRR